MKIRAHILQSPEPESLAALEKCLQPNVAVTHGAAVPQPPEYEILVGGRPERKQLAASPNIRSLIVPFTGIPQRTRSLLHEFPEIAVHNLHHNSAAVAEMAMALMLAAAKSLVRSDGEFRRRNWAVRRAEIPSLLLDGKSALILGFGHIGRRIARGCLALGMRVRAVSRCPKKGRAEGVNVYPPSDLRELLPGTSALLIALPITAETMGLIGPEELALLPADVVLVNVGRGETVDEEHLFLALRDGRLGAAGLDVWYRYPSDDPIDRTPAEETAPSAFPFHELPNVVMSPHRSSKSDQNERLRMEHLAVLLNAAAKGETMPNRVSISRGY
ncbi:MAG: hydroxyacid dehydrogenase [Armatimonadetes bacterium]|nr:hydroxyacid dehydrogenase [Armatimonadota bacterium]